MPCKDIVISANCLTKKYRIYDSPFHRLAHKLKLGDRKYYQDFTALENVSFEIRKGETIGIIGRNGSGKSTLLQLISGILKPTTGSISVNGKVAALLELGAGFHPEFTGRENVFMHGAIMGMSRQRTEARFEEIMRFADIGSFIEQPVKTYSSGMFLRLAFAVAINMEPDILVIDEALAVGDALFQKRCYTKIRQMHQDGLTLVFVSHDHELVRTLTEKALVLSHGKTLFWGRTQEATHCYRKTLIEQEAVSCTEGGEARAQSKELASESSAPAFGIGGVQITGLRVLGPEGASRTAFLLGERMGFEIAFLVEIPVNQLNVSIVIRTVQGVKVYSWGTFNQDISLWAKNSADTAFWEHSFDPGDEIVVTLLLDGNLGAGEYEVQVIVSRELDRQYGSQQVLHWCDEMAFFRVVTNPREYSFGGICDLHGKAVFSND